MHLKTMLYVVMLSAAPAFAASTEWSVGTEAYRETYREYENGTERLMQQRGNMWSLNAGVTQRFDERHALKLEGRYSKGKIQYIGSRNNTDEGYGAVKSDHLPRKAYDMRALYEYTHPLSENVKAKLEGGLGYRVLKDLSTRKDPSDYDRTNKMLYAQIGAGLDITLPHGLAFEPKVSYNHMLMSRQYTYITPTLDQKQRGGKGIEIDLPLSKTLANRSKVSLAPFYRGWKVPDSDDIAYVDENGEEGILVEPKNYTHEAGVRLKYTF